MLITYIYRIYLLLCIHTILATQLCIFDNYTRPNAHKNNAILYEFIKSMPHAKHIMLSPSLWHSYIRILSKKKRSTFLTIWKVYDTRIGLLYVKRKKSEEAQGLKTNTFKRLRSPFKHKAHDWLWVVAFPQLFDVQKWQTFHQSTHKKSIIYLSGHGSYRFKKSIHEIACGIPKDALARLLHFFHSSLHVDILGIQTCYWTPMRILELIKQKNGITEPNFGIVTPLYTEKPIWIAPPNSLEHHGKKHTLSFIRALQLIAHHYDDHHNNKNIATIKTITKKIDNIMLQKNRKQVVTFKPAGDIFTHVL